MHVTNCMFVWNIVSGSYKILESTFEPRLHSVKQGNMVVQGIVLEKLPAVNCKRVRDMSHRSGKSVQYLRDPDNYIQISLDKHEFDSGTETRRVNPLRKLSYRTCKTVERTRNFV